MANTGKDSAVRGWQGQLAVETLGLGAFADKAVSISL